MKLHLCQVYKNRPECCRYYPWNDGNDIFEDCQFYNQETKELRTLEEQLKLNTQQEIEEFCIKCGRCCYYWENGRRIHACSQLKVVEVPDGKFSLPVVG